MLFALPGFVPRLQLDWGYRKKYLSAIAIGALYLGWWWVDLQYREPSLSAQFGNNLSVAFALALMMMQALQFYWRDSRGLPGIYPFLGILALGFAADLYFNSKIGYARVVVVIMAFGLLVGLFYAAHHRADERHGAVFRRRRYTLLALCYFLSFLLASGTAFVIHNSEKAVGQWLISNANLGDRLTLGNRPTARLDSMSDIKANNFDHIALEIVAESSPGYLRGQIYDRYGDRTWSALSFGESPEPVQNPPAGYVSPFPESDLYPVAADADTLRDTLVVYSEPAIDRAMFSPKETGWVTRPTGGVMVNEATVVQADNALHGEPYALFTAANVPTVALTEDERTRYTGLPPDIAPRLVALAGSIVGDQSSTLGKINAITQHFTTNYDYKIGIQVPRGMDPMTYFLFSEPRPDAHCEYFATGAALLLRAVDVPTRYVTGVGVWEQHPFADYWVGRNRDAHAWVEAWDDVEGWVIVEATPAAGLPEAGQGQKTNAFRDFWSMITLTVKRFIAALREGAWSAMGGLLRALVVGVAHFFQAAWWLVLLLIGGGVGLWRLRHWIFRGRSADKADIDRQRQALNQQLTVMDRWVRKRRQITRKPHTTIHAFANEIEGLDDEHRDHNTEIAEWYRRWALVRYRGRPGDTEIRDLEQELRQRLKKSRKRG